MVSSQKNFKLAITGAFGALVIVLGITRLGFISISPTVSYTILQIPVIFAAVFGGLFSGIAVGAVFGIMSAVMAAISPSGALDPLFVNPLVSVVPRVMIGVVAWLVYTGLCRIRVPKILSAIVSAYFGTFTNTLLVFAALFTCYAGEITDALEGIGYWAVIALHIPSAVVESTIGAVLLTAVLGVTIAKKGGKSKLNSEEFDSVNPDSTDSGFSDSSDSANSTEQNS